MGNQPLQFDNVTEFSIYMRTYEAMQAQFKKQYGDDHFFVGPQKVVGSESNVFGGYGLDSEIIRMLGEHWKFRLGRKPDNDLVIDVPIISGYHAVINHDNANTYLEDLASTNGTFLNEDKIDPNDSVSIGPNSRIVLGVQREGIYNPPWIFYDCDSFMGYLSLLKKRRKKVS